MPLGAKARSRMDYSNGHAPRSVSGRSLRNPERNAACGTRQLDPGDRAEDVFRHYAPRISRHLLRLTRNRYDAEELTQSVFLEVTEALSDPSRRPRNVLAWLYAVADRRFVDEMRRRARLVGGDVEVLANFKGTIQTGSIAMAETLNRSLARQAEQNRQVLILKLLRGCTFDEISRAVGASEAACKMRFSRSLLQLRADFEREGFRPASTTIKR